MIYVYQSSALLILFCGEYINWESVYSNLLDSVGIHELAQSYYFAIFHVEANSDYFLFWISTIATLTRDNGTLSTLLLIWALS